MTTPDHEVTFSPLQTPTYPDLRQRHVLVTGGANGIGAAIVRAFAQQGCRITIFDRDVESGKEVVEECRRITDEVNLIDVELTDPESLSAALNLVRDMPVVDVLIANAGYDPRFEMLDMTDEEWNKLFDLNVKHYFAVCRGLLPSMIEAGREGSIIMTASHTAWLAKPDLIAYNATKAAIIGFVRSLAEAAGVHGIRVNAVAPGWTMTERQKEQWLTPEAKQTTIHELQALPLEITPEELVGTYLFLASTASRPLTRQILVADCGQSKH